MKNEEDQIIVAGHPVQRYLSLPDGQIRGAAVLFHGQGDHFGRYKDVLPTFLTRGIAIIGADLPGHGRSPGRRGHVPGIAFVNALVDSHRAHLAARKIPGPLGVLGHSCGGLLALHTLLRDPSPWDFAWLSSPLIKPEASQTPLRAALFLFLSRLAPWLSVDTGVRDADCLTSEGNIPPANAHVGPLFHTRITLAWAREIQEAAQSTRQQFRAKPPTIPLLITQGSDDPVCPPEEIRAVLKTTETSSAVYHEFAGLRHEPFADEHGGAVLRALAEFLEHQPQLTSPSG